MTIMQRIENDPTIGFTVSGRPLPETPLLEWQSSAGVPGKDNAFGIVNLEKEQ